MLDTAARLSWPWSMRVKRSRLVFSQSCSTFCRVVSPQVADHLVERVLQDGHLAAGLHPDLPGEVALGHRRGHLGDGPHLVGEVGGQLVDVVGQVLPDAADLLRLGLAAELAFDAHLAGHPRDLAGEGVELVDHGVDGVLQLEELALDVDRDLLAQVAVGHRRGHLGDVSHLSGQVAGHEVDVVGQVLPDAADLDGDRRGLAELALGADLAGDPGHLGDEPVELVDHGVDGVLQLQHLARGPRPSPSCSGRRRPRRR